MDALSLTSVDIATLVIISVFIMPKRVSIIDEFVPKFSKGSALYGGWEDHLPI